MKKWPLLAIAAAVFYAGGQHGIHGTTAGAAQVTSGSEKAFIRATLADLGAPATRANVSSLASWFPREFPSWPPMAANNPMASTMPAPGATIYNSVGVRNYVSASQGAHATAVTLANGHYPGIVAALRSGRGLCGGGLAGEFRTWSGGGYSSVC